MDLLTHVFLPLTVAYVLRRELFAHPAAFWLAGFGLLSDFDKFLGEPGLLHSLVTVVPICVAVLGAEWVYRGRWRYAPLVTGFIGSHLLLDIIDGGPVPLLYPVVKEGIGLQYPARSVFGEGPIGLDIEGPLVAARTVAPQPGHNTYGLITGQGVAWLLVFVVIVVALRYETEG